MGGWIQSVCAQARNSGQSGCYKRAACHLGGENRCGVGCGIGRCGQSCTGKRGNGLVASLLTEEEQFMVKRQLSLQLQNCTCRQLEEGFCHELVAMAKTVQLPRIRTGKDETFDLQSERAGIFKQIEQFAISRDDLLSCLVDLNLLDSAESPLWIHFYSKLKVEKGRCAEEKSANILERFSQRAGDATSGYETRTDYASRQNEMVQKSKLDGRSCDRQTVQQEMTQPIRGGKLQRKRDDTIFELKTTMIALYFLSGCKIKEKATHIVQLFHGFVNEHNTTQNSWSGSRTELKEVILRTDVEIRLVFETMAAVALQVLPHYAKHSSLDDFWVEQVGPQDFENGYLSNYTKLTSKWKSVQNRVVVKILNQFCRNQSSDGHQSTKSQAVLRKLTAEQFIDRAVKHFPHFFNPLGIRQEAHQEEDIKPDFDAADDSRISLRGHQSLRDDSRHNQSFQQPTQSEYLKYAQTIKNQTSRHRMELIEYNQRKGYRPPGQHLYDRVATRSEKQFNSFYV